MKHSKGWLISINDSDDLIVTWESPLMADLVHNGEGRDFDRLQEGKYIFYEQNNKARLQISAIIVEPEVKERRRNSSKFHHLQLVTKMNEIGGEKLLKGKKH